MWRKSHTCVCVKKFYLSQVEVLTILKKAVDDKILKLVKKNNKNTNRVVQKTDLDEQCISQNGETSESTDVENYLWIRLDKISHDDIPKLMNEFRLFKGEYSNNWKNYGNTS